MTVTPEMLAFGILASSGRADERGITAAYEAMCTVDPDLQALRQELDTERQTTASLQFAANHNCERLKRSAALLDEMCHALALVIRKTRGIPLEVGRQAWEVLEKARAEQ
jgi:hypothetical protein